MVCVSNLAVAVFSFILGVCVQRICLPIIAYLTWLSIHSMDTVYDDEESLLERSVRLTSSHGRTVGITPRKQRSTPAEEVRRVCVDCALAGLEAAYEASAPSTRGKDGKPKFRFSYMSGIGSERDPNKTPNTFSFMHEYCWMRVS